jgi:hypothetical protein
LSDKKGDALDLSYLNMPLNETGFNDINWSELAVLVNEYCNQSSLGQALVNDTYNYTSIAVDWAGFYAEWQAGPQNISDFTKSDLNVWIDNYNEFINAGGEVIMAQLRPSNASNMTNETATAANETAGAANETAAGANETAAGANETAAA